MAVIQEVKIIDIDLDHSFLIYSSDVNQTIILPLIYIHRYMYGNLCLTKTLKTFIRLKAVITFNQVSCSPSIY